MSQKIFSENGTRIHIFVGNGEHAWDLKDNSGKVYFSGSAEELNSHVDEMIKEGNYSYKSKKGKKKKEED